MFPTSAVSAELPVNFIHSDSVVTLSACSIPFKMKKEQLLLFLPLNRKTYKSLESHQVNSPVTLLIMMTLMICLQEADVPAADSHASWSPKENALTV
jgi:hypothetical protein